MHSDEIITLDHGAGGTMMRRLVQELFVQSFGDDELTLLGDGARVSTAETEHVFTTDSYVVQPIEFSGGDIGKLAVCGTVNDLLVMGARPLYLSIAMIIEEGLPFEVLKRITHSIASTAAVVPVRIVTGDTKVVPSGHCDKLFINTSGIGSIPLGKGLSSDPIEVGDAILVSGTLGDHAIAIMSARSGFNVTSDVTSDCAPLAGIVETMLQQHNGVKWMRDATRGGLAAVLDEFCTHHDCAAEISEGAVPVAKAVRAICDLLGYEPMHLANEGKLVAVVAGEQAEQIVKDMRQSPYGENSAIIGSVVSLRGNSVRVVTETGGIRTMRRPTGELLPRIC